MTRADDHNFDDFLMLGVFAFLEPEETKKAEFLKSLAYEFTGDLADACSDIGKDIFNKLGFAEGEEQAAMMLGSLIGALCRVLAFHLGNYEQPHRNKNLELIKAYLTVATENSADYIRRMYPRKER